jgi:hypothetical protein
MIRRNLSPPSSRSKTAKQESTVVEDESENVPSKRRFIYGLYGATSQKVELSNSTVFFTQVILKAWQLQINLRLFFTANNCATIEKVLGMVSNKETRVIMLLEGTYFGSHQEHRPS